ncbi:MAG: mechanosensitive ion channel family protein [Pirellulaceae bacterium]|nr:mechanosensitive ion channel family protein [Pirellulaceae bacterium]
MRVQSHAFRRMVARMLDRRLMLPISGVAIGGLFSGSTANATDDVGAAGEEAARLAAQKLEDAKGTLANAVSGDTEAMISLVTEFVVPVAIAAAVIFVGYIVAGYAGRTIGGFISKRVDETLGRFAGKVTKTMISLFVLLGVLSYYGFDVTSFAAILAAVGFAIGMALAGTIGNFAAGIMLLIFRPFKVGDYVVMAGTEGIVEAIDLFTTDLDTLDNRRLIVPNGEIFGATIENVTHNKLRRVDVNVGCDYEADLDDTRAALETAIRDIPKAVSEPPPEAYLMDLGDSAVNWQVRVWCRPVDYWAVRQDLTAATKKGLDAADISIPYPQLDVHFSEDTSESLQKPRRRDAPIVNIHGDSQLAAKMRSRAA